MALIFAVWGSSPAQAKLETDAHAPIIMTSNIDFFTTGSFPLRLDHQRYFSTLAAVEYIMAKQVGGVFGKD
jgi:hypothetical protein